MILLTLSMLFWGGIFLFLRGYLAAKKTGHEAEIARLKAAADGVQLQPQPKSPSLAGRAAKGSLLGTFKALKWAGPRIAAGAAKSARFTGRLTKTAVTSAQANMAKRKAAKQQPAAAPMAQPVSPEQDWAQYDVPAYQRAKESSTSSRQTLH